MRSKRKINTLIDREEDSYYHATTKGSSIPRRRVDSDAVEVPIPVVKVVSNFDLVEVFALGFDRVIVVGQAMVYPSTQTPVVGNLTETLAPIMPNDVVVVPIITSC